MTHATWIFTLATLSGGLGLWWLLPRGSSRARSVGAILAAVALGLVASQIGPVGDWLSGTVFYAVAAVTVFSAAVAMTLRNPVYCAIWFGMSLVGTAGLMLFQGAQFLAMATIVVYAGAILVTFLFVLMLAQPSGRAHYDRTSDQAIFSAFAGTILIGILSATVTSVLSAPARHGLPVAATAEERLSGVLAPSHVARLGVELFDRYPIAVEVVGVLLLVALVGAAAIVGQSRGPLAGPAVSLDRPLPKGDHHDG